MDEYYYDKMFVRHILRALAESLILEENDSARRASGGCYIYMRMLPIPIDLENVSLSLLANVLNFVLYALIIQAVVVEFSVVFWYVLFGDHLKKEYSTFLAS